jgi:preprotein translocase subunit SecG
MLGFITGFVLGIAFILLIMLFGILEERKIRKQNLEDRKMSISEIKKYIKEHPVTLTKITTVLSALVSLILVILSYINDYGYMITTITDNLDTTSASVITTILFICIALAGYFNWKSGQVAEETESQLRIALEMSQNENKTLQRQVQLMSTRDTTVKTKTAKKKTAKK